MVCLMQGRVHSRGLKAARFRSSKGGGRLDTSPTGSREARTVVCLMQGRVHSRGMLASSRLCESEASQGGNDVRFTLASPLVSVRL